MVERSVASRGSTVCPILLDGRTCEQEPDMPCRLLWNPYAEEIPSYVDSGG